jgi:hypothetical protein
MSDLRTALAKGPVIVKFLKADDSERIMTATTNPSLFSWTPSGKTGRTKQPNPDVLAVWDLDINQWRSIRLDRVIEWKPKE